MTTAQTQGIKKYVVVYLALVVLTAVQFFVGYQNLEGGALIVRMLTFGGIETVLVVLFLMNLSTEKRSFFNFFVFFMLFVLTTMNIIWTDSFRLLVFRLTNTGPS
ncbi:MAG TPA: cytochrome C oxidase subunit IV family protein [Candidatus Sulfotelmatobacter sp.]|nr:cytochrome C oxidase subunit IV family protein [Candidatus Sulfotelmatobacter sp.]